MKYKIYHVPGVKVGCSTDPEHRVARQFGPDQEYEILEESDDIDYISEREIHYQLLYFGKRDNNSSTYKDSYENWIKYRDPTPINEKMSLEKMRERQSKAVKTRWKKDPEGMAKVHGLQHGMSDEEFSKWQGQRTKHKPPEFFIERGKKIKEGRDKMTSEKKHKAAEKLWKTRKLNPDFHKIMSETAKKGWITRKANKALKDAAGK